MKAVMAERYGGPDVLRLVQAEKPIPKENEVLIRVEATVAAPPDCAFRQGRPLMSRLFSGLLRPMKIPGDVFAGIVEAVGKNVSQVQPGDRVFGSSGDAFGTNAEYLVLPESVAIAIIPDGVTMEEAAAVSEGGLTALPFLRDSAKLGKGQRILIIGASGGVGVYAVQLACHLGAEVTAVCGRANAELLRSLGAVRVIDYATEDFTASGERYDVIFDAVAKSTFTRCRKALTPEGIYLSTVPSVGLLSRMLLASLTHGKKVIFSATGLRKPHEKQRDLEYLAALMKAGYLKAAIGRTFPLEQIADAHRYVETGHKVGSAVVLMG